MNEVNPIHYRITLEPDLKTFRFEGRTELFVKTGKPMQEIPLNALDLAIWRCQVRLEDVFVDCPFSMDPKKEEVRISLPKEMMGEIHLRIDYVGEINDRMAGFYRSKYAVGGEERYMALTQFEESDARRAFPCFDHPLKKATFDVEMLIQEGLVAISNAPVKEEVPAGPGKKRVVFQKTPRMSTYLLFFGVGEFQFIEDQGEVLIRAAAVPGMITHASFGLQFGRKALVYSEDYYGIRYPLPKLDLIAIADFAAGAMENWGAITFRENLLLHFPGITSRAGEERICEVIAHEMAHQWFGNLVTPSDWKYLWLNESFATYFGYGMVSHYHPEWEIWDQFLGNTTDVAMERDALKENFPIEIPGGEHVIINVSTAPIIYNKGGSILRQVEAYVGEQAFRDGLRSYLKRHAYDCASSHHLWESLEDVSERPVTRMMKSWIEQPGFPMVEVEREGDTLIFSQRRFTYLPDSFAQEWLIPIHVMVFMKDGGRKTLQALMDTKTMVLGLGSDALSYMVNSGRTGFYRVAYKDLGNLEDLGRRASEKDLSPVDRWGLQNDLYAMVRRGDVSLQSYLEFLVYYSQEDAFLPLSSIAGNLHHAYLITEGLQRERIAALGRGLFERVLREIGYEPRPDERHTLSLLRDQILYHAALYGSEEALLFATGRFDTWIQGKGTVHPDIMKSVMRVGALMGGHETFQWLDQRLQSTESEHERMNILAALGSFTEEAWIQRVEQYILEKVPARNRFVPIGYLAGNPYAVPFMWEWYTGHLEEMEAFHPMHYERVIAAIVPICGLGKEAEVRGFFEAYMKRTDRARDAIRLSLERLEINARMRRA